MVNFPVAVGTSGHLCGGALAAVLLGPWAASAALTVVLAIQCLLFGDGGLLELGANVINIGLVGCWFGYAVYRSVRAAIPGRSQPARGCGGHVGGIAAVAHPQAGPVVAGGDRARRVRVADGRVDRVAEPLERPDAGDERVHRRRRGDAVAQALGAAHVPPAAVLRAEEQPV